jgi:hypothetical protein
MEKDYFLNKTIEYVDYLFGNKDQHFVRALYWLCQLEPNADEAVKTAAYSHDTERAICAYDIGAFLLVPEVLRKHQENGAAEIHSFLLREGASPEFALKVKNLISKHEDGGSHEQNVIKDADSISYFETNSVKHAAWTDKFSKEEIKAKFDWMYNRISLDKAREIAKPLYDKVINILEKTQ